MIESFKVFISSIDAMVLVLVDGVWCWLMVFGCVVVNNPCCVGGGTIRGGVAAVTVVLLLCRAAVL